MTKKIWLLFLTAVMVFSLISCGTKISDNSNKSIENLIIRADYPMYENAQELVDAADLVFTGTVTSIKYEMLNVEVDTGGDSASDTPYTIFEVLVSKVYKGNIDSKTVYLKRPGGQFESTEYVLDGATAIRKNKDYLFIAAEFVDSYPS